MNAFDFTSIRQCLHITRHLSAANMATLSSDRCFSPPLRPRLEYVEETVELDEEIAESVRVGVPIGGQQN